MKTTQPTPAMLALLAKIAEYRDRHNITVDVAGRQYRTATVNGLRERGLITVAHTHDRSVETRHGRGDRWHVSTDHKVPVLLATVTPEGRAVLAKGAK